MLSGYDDAYRVFSDNVGTACVKGNKIVIDPQIKRWIAQTKTYTDKGYNNKANLWSNESFKGARTVKYSDTSDQHGSSTSVSLLQHWMTLQHQRSSETVHTVTGHSVKVLRASLGVEPGFVLPQVQIT